MATTSQPEGAAALSSSNVLVAGKYRLGRKLGGGSFGEIFLVGPAFGLAVA